MRKAFLKASILTAVGLAMSASFTSCKDYDDDINRINSEIAAIHESVKKIQDLVNSGSVITNVTQNGDGVTFTLSNGQSYTVTNGKDGAAGKDADVWTLEKNAEGAWYWAKNGELTDVPAQGPAGENGKPGDGLPGNYYVPNEETGCFDLYDGKTNKLIEPTDIRWKPADEEQIAAVDCGDYVVITGLKGYDQPLKIWKSSYIKSLVVKPELYLDGIESVRYGIIQEIDLKKLNSTGANGSAEIQNVNSSKVYNDGTPDGTSNVTANVLANQPFSLSLADKVNNKVPTFYAMEKATIKYAVNPSNAAISKVNWTLAFDDIEVVNRSSYIGGEVLKEPAPFIDENGDVNLTYQLNDYAYDYLAPFEYGENTDKPNKWTFMALKAQVNDEDSLVTSDNVAVIAKKIELTNIIVDNNKPVSLATAVPVAKSAADAIQYAYDKDAKQTPVPVVTIPYNETSNLADHLAISITQTTPMIDGDNGTENKNTTQVAEPKNDIMTLKEAATKWDLTMNYQLVDYAVNPNKTSESKYASLDGSEVTPQYVDASGNWQDATKGDQGRSAVGRRPLVYVSLTDADNNIVLAGFVKLEIVEKDPLADHVELSPVEVPYICDYEIESNWTEISGKVYEALNLTANEFSKSFKLADGTPVENKEGVFTTTNVYINVNDEWIQTTNNKDYYKKSVEYGTFTWDSNEDGSHTQKLVFGMTNENLKTWYAYVKGDGTVGFNPTTDPRELTVYAKFVSTNEYINKVVYIGFPVKVIGLPAASYTGKLASSWAENENVVPVNPAVPGQTETGIYGNSGNKYNYAQVMGTNFISVWKGGDPTVTAEGYTFVNEFKANTPSYAVGNVTANYEFADKQNNHTITLANGNKYEIVRNGKIGSNTDVHALYAYKYVNGSVDTSKNGQPIAVINANHAALDELGGNAGTLGSTSNAGGVWNRIDFLSVYGKGTNGEVIAPSHGTAPAGGWQYGEFACDIINNAAYDYNNTPVQFNVVMAVTYTQNGKTCVLRIPKTETFKVGAGRPVSIYKGKDATLQDANDNKTVLASQLFQMIDWQGHVLWTVNTKGAVSSYPFNGAIVGDYWMSINTDNQPTYNNVTWPTAPAGKDITAASLEIDLANAIANDGTKDLGKFVDVYADKHIDFAPATGPNYVSGIEVTDNVATITDWRALDDLKITWTNNGNSVTSNIYIKIPVYLNYIWGQNVLLTQGEDNQVVLTIQPTLQGNN